MIYTKKSEVKYVKNLENKVKYLENTLQSTQSELKKSNAETAVNEN